jgi:hypothetical protein
MRFACMSVFLLMFSALPAGAQAASAHALGSLGPAKVWRCEVSREQGLPFPFPNPVMMTFVLLEPSAPSVRSPSQRMPLRSIIAGFTQEGEPLTYSEIVLDSTADPQLQMPQVRRDARGVYSGTRSARDTSSRGSPGHGQVPMTAQEIAQTLELAKELWRRRCAGPRA